MSYWKPSEYTIKNALIDIMNGHYSSGDIVIGSNYIIKDHGDKAEIHIDAETPKGHVSYDLFFDENDKLIDWKKHR